MKQHSGVSDMRASRAKASESNIRFIGFSIFTIYGNIFIWFRSPINNYNLMERITMNVDR